MLLEEEMRRAIQYGDSKVKWWLQRTTQRTVEDATLEEGLRAYALEHLAQERAFMDILIERWAGVRWRAQMVLDNLAKPGFPKTQLELDVAVPIPVKVDIGDDGDFLGDDREWLAETGDAMEEEMAEVERIA